MIKSRSRAWWIFTRWSDWMKTINRLTLPYRTSILKETSPQSPVSSIISDTEYLSRRSMSMARKLSNRQQQAFLVRTLITSANLLSSLTQSLKRDFQSSRLTSRSWDIETSASALLSTTSHRMSLTESASCWVWGKETLRNFLESEMRSKSQVRVLS